MLRRNRKDQRQSKWQHNDDDFYELQNETEQENQYKQRQQREPRSGRRFVYTGIFLGLFKFVS